MKNAKILDCTLRDGGYINSFRFGKKTITGMLDELAHTNVDLIECGFLQSGNYDENVTLFSDVESIRRVMPKKNKDVMYVALVKYGKISADEIAPRDGRSIDGIRVAFHANEIEGAIAFAHALMEKGYAVFMQTVGTTSYSDRELLDLVEKMNELHPYAFYFVDTLGMMYQKEIRRFFYLIDNNLQSDIQIGFHAHNNLQQAFSNAVELLRMDSPRQLIIDSSVQGLGRGAGNLCTELILQYINENIGKRYDMIPVLNIIDRYISPLRVSFEWGYSAAYYLSATKSCHPNYAKFLLNKQTLQSVDVNRIMDTMDEAKRDIYDEAYIAKLYTHYKSRQIDDSVALERLRGEIGDKRVVVVAPGKSVLSVPASEWMNLSQTGYILAVNFLPETFVADRVFFSNEKRYLEVADSASSKKLVLASNIPCATSENIVINYNSYLNDDAEISDNAGLMCINLLEAIGIRKIELIGFDGYAVDQTQNYTSDAMFYDLDRERIASMNAAITRFFKQRDKKTEFVFLTPSQYESR